jgi:hypothetical protein
VDRDLYRLDNALQELTRIFQNDITDCDIASKVSDQQWYNMIVMVFRTRKYAEQAMRDYFELAAGVGDPETNKAHIRDDLAETTKDMYLCLYGNELQDLPTAPTQHIVSAFHHANELWQMMEVGLSFSVAQNDFSESSIAHIGKLNEGFLADMTKVGHYLVDECHRAAPHLPSAVWELAERQLELVQELGNEALLVYMGINVEQNKAAYSHIATLFENSHWKLLLGPGDPRLRNGYVQAEARRRNGESAGHRRLAGAGGVDPLLLDDSVAPTHDPCTLREMETVLARFGTLDGVLQQVMGNDTTIAATAKDSFESAIYGVSNSLKITASFYHKIGTCDATVLSETGWEKSLYALGNAPFLYQQALTEFSLMTLKAGDDNMGRDYSSTWGDISAATLVEHEEFCAENANDPSLVGTLIEFKQAWDAFRPTDAERLLGLQVAYITLNPHPAGSKDILDVAPGDEEYHAVHLQYHPTYRGILYDKNYYDIFMLDTEGNCIYSVYKELDYATNFLPNGPGEWKDSGLGEAFVAAMANPDKVNIIDWKPYGPSAGALASFLATGVRDTSGVIVGVYCTQMPPESIPRDSQLLLDTAVNHADDTFWNFRFGQPAMDTPTPPTKTVSDRLFSVVEAWDLAKPLLQGDATSATLSDLLALVSGSVDLGDDLVKAFADAVGAIAPSFPYKQLARTGQQKALVQRMCALAMWIVHKEVTNTTHLSSAMATFEEVQIEMKALGLGGAARRLAAPSVLNDHLAKIDSAWNALAPILKTVSVNLTFGMEGKNSEQMFAFVRQAEEVIDAVQNSFEFLGTTTQTTTLEPVRILSPMAMSGSWAAGATMRVAVLLAQRMINEQQIILPGMDIEHKFFDDQCDGRETSRIVLEEMNKDDTFVALGGVGCSQACADSSFVAETLKLPFVAYECAATRLSNPLVYPGLTRFGTVTVGDPMFDAIRAIGDNNSWSHIIIISSGGAEERAEAAEIQALLDTSRFTTENILGLESDWDQLVKIFTSMKESTRGKQRNVFLVGSETFSRKLLCASIKAEVMDGITWISHGGQRNMWWNRSDMAYDFQMSWLREEATSARVKQALEDFSMGWDDFGTTDESRSVALTALYMTDAKLDLYTVPGREPYHLAHTLWHPHYHRLLFERSYYDIFIFDLRGNLIYSVYKESDYATNFAPGGTGPWKDSGLGEAFSVAYADPENLHYIDWSPYGPSGYADAAFFTTGIVNSSGHKVGVYTIQLPPSYEQSIDKLHPEECSLNALTASYEGAINIAGLGRPVAEEMEKPLDCFKGHSAKSFYFELDGYLRDGFPGHANSAVPDPYTLLRGNAADATCFLAFMLRHFMSQGRSLQEIQNPSDDFYDDIQAYIKAAEPFQGATGTVAIVGNDKPNNLLVQQVQQGVYVEVGTIGIDGNRTWSNGGVSAAAWKNEHIDPLPPKAEEFNAFVEVILPFFFVVIPILLLLALSPLLCLVVIWVFKTFVGRVSTEGDGGGGASA